MSTAISVMRPGMPLLPLYPTSIEEAVRFSRMALASGVLVKRTIGYGEKAVEEADDAAIARGTMIVMQGMEVGVPPMQAIQLFAMINGRITAHSEAVPGILLANGYKIRERWTGTEMTDNWTCHIELTRPGGDKHEACFSVADAKQARLWDQNPVKKTKFGDKPNDAAWFRYPKRLLKARALGFCGKDFAADTLRGIQVREEADDIVAPMRDVTPVAATILHIPDAPPSDPEPPDDPPITDSVGLLWKIRVNRENCESEAELEQLRLDMAPLMERLEASHRILANDILKSDEEGGEF